MAKKKHDENSVKIALSARLDSTDAEDRYLANILRNGCPISDDGFAKLKGKDLVRFALLSIAKKYDNDFPLERAKTSQAVPTEVESEEKPTPTKKGATRSDPKPSSLYANASTFVLEKKA